VYWVLLAAAWSAAVSPATEPVAEIGDAAGGEAIGVVWHDQATVEPAVQQRLVDALVARTGLQRAAVVGDASTLARARVALELPRSRVEVFADWRARLDEASVAYRAGQLPAARVAVSGLLEVLQADPVVPGAATLAWRAHMLGAQLSWAEGDAAGLEQAIAAAVALDPDARPSTRQLPPPVVEAYLRQRDAVVAEAATWPTIAIAGAPGVPFAVEIDGVPGRRPVPPGEHLVVVRRPGVEPVGARVHTSTPWVIPDALPVLPAGLPTDRELAQRICESAELGWLVLARLRDDRLGLQRYACGVGFGPVWYQARDGWAPGIDAVIAGPHDGFGAAPGLHGDAPWPAVPPPSQPRPAVLSDGGSVPYRARLRRVLPWMLIGGAIAGAVTVGVIFGGEPSPSLAIDGNGFLRP
jgi:hypothetical protein